MTEPRPARSAFLLGVIAAVVAIVAAWSARDDLRSIRLSIQPFADKRLQARTEREMRIAFQKGVEHLRQKRFNEAASAFHRVLAIDPRQPEAHVNMGFALFELGDLKGARSFFYSAKTLDPRMDSADYGLALVLHAEGHRREAIVRMQRYADKLAPGDPNRLIALRRLSEMTLAAGAAADTRPPLPPLPGQSPR